MTRRNDPYGVIIEPDIDVLVRAAKTLPVEPRGERWTHLSLCVLDAVFSISARYRSVVNVCRHYADHAELANPFLPAADIDQVVGAAHEQALGVFVATGHELGPDRLAAEVLHNRGRTSTHNGIRKAEAAIRYADTLTTAGVNTLGDVAVLAVDKDRLSAVERELRAGQRFSRHPAELPVDGRGRRP